MNSQSSQLLAADDPHAVRILNPQGRSPFLLIGDHAGDAVPARLGSLGVGPTDMARHIAIDIGVGGVGAMLARALDAVFVRQTYSRLVIDCNRDPASPDAMPGVSDGTMIPANQDLSAEDRAERIAAIHAPYQAAIAAEIARRDTAGMATVLVSLHSFTPTMGGRDRPWQIGILHGGGDTRFALTALRLLQARDGLCVGDNEPYAMDGIDYTVPLHAFPAGRPYVEIELRQDLIARDAGQAAWSATLATLLADALSEPGGAIDGLARQGEIR